MHPVGLGLRKAVAGAFKKVGPFDCPDGAGLAGRANRVQVTWIDEGRHKTIARQLFQVGDLDFVAFPGFTWLERTTLGNARLCRAENIDVRNSGKTCPGQTAFTHVVHGSPLERALAGIGFHHERQAAGVPQECPTRMGMRIEGGICFQEGDATRKLFIRQVEAERGRIRPLAPCIGAIGPRGDHGRAAC